MDEPRLDVLLRLLAGDHSRRGVVGWLGGVGLGGMLVLLGLSPSAAKRKKRRQRRRRRRNRSSSPPPGNTCTDASCSAVLLAAGDIASCASSGDEATAAILDGLAGTIAALGDLVYDAGTPGEYAACYEPSWGQHRSRTRPAPGNHDYATPAAAGYYGYFGAAAGDPSQGYYSYQLGSWHIVVLNSNCNQVGGCGTGSPQETWLRADLAAHPQTCTLAYWHHPRFSSGSVHGSNLEVAPLWQALYDHGADVVLAGHEHHYERFAPQDGNGQLDLKAGMRQFVVGTGGRSHYGFGVVQPNSEVRNGDTYGVLELTLQPTGYDWRFVPEAGKTFADVGSGVCHGLLEVRVNAEARPSYLKRKGSRGSSAPG